MLSFWEKDEFLNYDHIIVGAGIVGLSTAISIKENYPKARVLVLERGTFPTGASTKNAGFACFGSLTEILSDLKLMPEQEVFDLVKLRWEGLQLLRERVGDEALDYHNLGGYELMRSADMPALEEMNRVNALLMPLFGQRVYQDRSEEIEKLESVAFQWDPLSIAWEHHFVALVIWKEKNGYNKDPPIDYKTFIPCDKEDKHISLGGWCFYQRWRKKHKWDKRKQEEGHYGREAAEIIRRLESVGFLWGETRKLLHPRKKADETTMHKNKKKLIL